MNIKPLNIIHDRQETPIEPVAPKTSTKRIYMLDTLRALTLISMIAYHFCWDLSYIVRLDMPWYQSQGAYIWQQSICRSFIIISGMCIAISRHPIRRGLLVSVCGAIVTIVTAIFMPEDIVIFGVLTFLGSAMIITGLLLPSLEKTIPLAGMIVSLILFHITFNISGGYLQILGNKILTLPSSLYSSYPMTYLGFMHPGFYSTDYFAILPWLFLYLAGYFFCKYLLSKNIFDAETHSLLYKKVPVLSFLGKHSLLIYLLHQPLLYAICLIL